MGYFFRFEKLSPNIRVYWIRVDMFCLNESILRKFYYRLLIQKIKIFNKKIKSTKMKSKPITYVLSIIYFIFCIFVIFHNAKYRLDTLFSGKYLVFLGISLLVFVVILKIIHELSNDEGNEN
jgi:hypothetical protein